jgi:hypothetical protein
MNPLEVPGQSEPELQGGCGHPTECSSGPALSLLPSPRSGLPAWP